MIFLFWILIFFFILLNIFENTCHLCECIPSSLECCILALFSFSFRSRTSSCRLAYSISFSCSSSNKRALAFSKLIHQMINLFKSTVMIKCISKYIFSLRTHCHRQCMLRSRVFLKTQCNFCLWAIKPLPGLEPLTQGLRISHFGRGQVFIIAMHPVSVPDLMHFHYEISFSWT